MEAALSLPATAAPPRGRWFRRAVLACLAVAFLPIGLGSVVTSLDVGMAVPDWPTTFGQNMLTYPVAEMTRSTGVFLEHSHRLAGVLIGFCSVLLVVTALGSRGLALRLRLLAVLALLLVSAQGLIGGLRILENDRAIAMVHGLGAQAVLALFVVLARLSSPVWTHPLAPPLRAGEAAAIARLRLWTPVALAVLAVHLFAGAGLRHQQASLGAHLLLAVVVSGVLLFLVHLCLYHLPERRTAGRLARALVALLGVQLGLGLATWAFKYGPAAARASTELHATLASLHLLAGAGITALLVALTLEAHGRLARASLATPEVAP